MTTPAPAATALTWTVSSAELDTITRPAPADGADHVAVPRSQWNATAMSLAMTATAAIDPVTHLGFTGDTPQYKFTERNGHPTIGAELGASLDAWTSSPDDVSLSAAERDRRLYVQACAWTLVAMGRNAQAQAQAAPAPAPATGWFALAVGVGAVVVIAAVSIVAYAWAHAQTETETIRAKSAEHQHAVNVATGGSLYQARLAEWRRTGTMPPASEQELAVRDSVVRAARQHRDEARDGYIASALRSLRDAAGAAASSGSSVAAWAAVGALLWLMTKGR